MRSRRRSALDRDVGAQRCERASHVATLSSPTWSPSAAEHWAAVMGIQTSGPTKSMTRESLSAMPITVNWRSPRNSVEPIALVAPEN